MGGISGDTDNGLCSARAAATRPRSGWIGLPYLNTTLSNTLKVLTGFIPALFTFLYTQEWWVLAWLGAPIWFAITGVLQRRAGHPCRRRHPQGFAPALE